MALNVMYVTKKQEVLVAVIDRNDSLTCWNNSGCTVIPTPANPVLTHITKQLLRRLLQTIAGWFGQVGEG